MNRKINVLLVIVLLHVVTSACSGKSAYPVNIAKNVFPTTIETSTKIQPTITPTQTPLLTATLVPLTIKDLWLQKHEEERIRYLDEQGPAETIPALEYHGDAYNMQFGDMLYELTPEAFGDQMRWFHDNNVHAVTGEELVKWLDGEIELPKKSVLLTFDLAGSDKAVIVPRIVKAFELYGMHGIFNICLWSSEMKKSPSWCENDECWQNFRDAYNSGTVTIASHSIDHPDFAELSEVAGLMDLEKSRESVEEHIGGDVLVNIIAWPFESVPTWADSVETIGYAVAFGGSTYPISENAVHRERIEDRYRLPRIFPPNSDGFSMRPYGKTLKEIMEMYWNLGN